MTRWKLPLLLKSFVRRTNKLLLLWEREPFFEDEVDVLMSVCSNVPFCTLMVVYWNCSVVCALIVCCGARGTISGTQFQSNPTMLQPPGARQSLQLYFIKLCIRGLCRVSKLAVRMSTTASFCRGARMVSTVLLVASLLTLFEKSSSCRCSCQDAELTCSSRVLALLLAGQSAVALHGCSFTLFNVFSEWSESQYSPEPLRVVKYTPALCKAHVWEARFADSNCLDQFLVLDFLLVRLGGAMNQPVRHSMAMTLRKMSVMLSKLAPKNRIP